MKVGLIIGVIILLGIIFTKEKVSPKDKEKKETKDDIFNYKTLSPNDNVEIKAIDALDFSIKNNPKAQNIAITGPYSSGKSSIIQSYFKKNIEKDDYTIVSLAKFFSDEKKEDISTPTIEKIIIEKLYYSIFDKIKRNKFFNNLMYTILIMAFIIYILLYKIELKNIILLYKNKSTLIQVLVTIIIITIIMLVGFGIYMVIKNVFNSNKIKLKLDQAEIELEKKETDNTTSLLNEEISFIIDIIEMAKYKYIIFEDIDRLNDPIIFDRLRDLNVTLNSTLKKKIKFIYAIKDDILVAENRSKFFDFIFPVIPYTSYYNSSDEFYRIVKEEYKLLDNFSENFILDICLFVSDIRILNNTMNEYIIYKQTLNKKIKDRVHNEKLFSILLYKNVCSDDFAKLQLQDKSGFMYKILNSRNELVIQKNLEIEKLIQEKEKELENYNNFIFDNNNFIELLFTRFFLGRYTNPIKIKINNSTITINQKEELLNYIMNKNARWYDGNQYQELETILKEEFPELYNIYLKIIEKQNNKENIICNEIEGLKNKIKLNDELELCQLLNDSELMKKINFGKYDSLIKYLLLNGYIDETYNIFINIFHEGPLSQIDEIFLFNAKNKINQDWNYYIENPLIVCKRLNINDLKNSKIDNIFIIDTLLKNGISQKSDIVIKNIINSENYSNIVKEFFCNKKLKNKKLFILELCKKDHYTWMKIKKGITDENLLISIVQFILLYVDSKIIHQLEEYNDIVSYIERNNILLDCELDIIKNLIQPYKYVNISTVNQDTQKFLIENNIYKINIININTVLKYLKHTDQEIQQHNYETIQNEPNVKTYIEENITEYLNEVLLKLEIQNDSTDLIIKLLNNKEIDIELKLKIIDKEKFELQDISVIENNNLWSKLFSTKKIVLNSYNINKYYEFFELDQTLVYVLNNNDIEDNYWTNINDNLKKDILLNQTIDDKKYLKILKYIKAKVNSNDSISNLGNKKISLLISRNKFEYSSNIVCELLKKDIKLFLQFVKRNEDIIINDIENGNLILKKEETQNILSNCDNRITNKFINAIIKLISLEDIDLTLANIITQKILERNMNNILSKEKLLKIISLIKTIREKVELINNNFFNITQENVSVFLNKLNRDYCNLIVNGTMPKFDKKDYNYELINNLKTLGYNIEFESISDKQIRIKKKKRK